MDKNAIKKYAVWARRELIARVSQRAALYGITEQEIAADGDSINGHVLSSIEKQQRDALLKEIEDKGYEQVMEEVAYTWFNRFSALRFMEVNGYLPSHVRVFTDDDNAFKPQILAEVINMELDGLDLEKVYALKNDNDEEALFKYLIIIQCNALNKILPGMFQTLSDYTELLFPDNLLREGSVIQQMIEQIPEEDWQDAVQIIGWLYQYYNSEKKDDVFAALKKNVKITKENIPAATQLFTPDWIVRYMVENSLGHLWLEGHPDAKDQLLPTEEEQSAYAAGNRDPEDTKWHYYLEEAEQEPEVQAQLAEIRKEYAALTPDQLKVIDPCSGSGHILAYMFDVLIQIYESYGYTTREAVESIVENNLYGLDIDDRAAQLAYFAVMMKARQYDRRFFSRGIQPHVYAIVESNHVDKFAVDYFCNGDAKLTTAMDTIIKELQDAKEYGSILTVTQQDWSALYDRFAEITEDINMSRDTALRELLPLVQVAEALAQKYDVVVTNPPYMGSSGMSAKLSNFVKKDYPDSKSDLFSCFIERGNGMIKSNRFNCMVTMQSWMFLSSFEKMRAKTLQTKTITNLMHMENMVMGIAFGTVVTVFRNNAIKGYKGTYNQIKLQDIENDMPKQFPIQENRFAQVSTDKFSKIPGSPVAYWASNKMMALFENDFIGRQFISGGRNKTHNDEKYLRMLWEVPRSDRWTLYAKGGAYRKWYGDIEYLVEWTEAAKKEYASHGGLVNAQFWGKEGITWTIVTAYKASFRFKQASVIYSSVSPTIFDSSYKLNRYILALLNSKASEALLNVMNPTLATNVGDILGIPFLKKDANNVEKITEHSIALSKFDWDSFETSWDFKRNPLV